MAIKKTNFPYIETIVTLMQREKDVLELLSLEQARSLAEDPYCKILETSEEARFHRSERCNKEDAKRERGSRAKRKERHTNDNGSAAQWLAKYNGIVREPEDVISCFGLVIDIEGIPRGTTLIDENGNEWKTPTSKLCIAVLQENGQIILVNIRGSFWRHVGSITRPRADFLKRNLPDYPLEATDDRSIKSWLNSIGMKVK